MQLPVELWKLIIDRNFDIYKSCILVNKLLNRIVSQLYRKLPDQITMEIFNHNRWEFIVSSLTDKKMHKPLKVGIESTVFKYPKGNDLIFQYGLTVDNSINIFKNQLFSKYIYLWVLRKYYVRFPLLLEYILDENYNLICDYVQLDGIPSLNDTVSYWQY